MANLHIFTIVQKDLAQVIRDKKSQLFLVLMPVVFTLIFGFAFRSQEKEARLPIGLVNRDPQSTLTDQLLDLIASNVVLEFVPLEDEVSDIEKRVEDEVFVAVVIVPEGFSNYALTGEPLPLTVIVPNTMAGQTATTAIQAAAKRFFGGVQAAQLSVESMATQHPLTDQVTKQTILEDHLAQAISAWQHPAFTVELEPAITIQAARGRTPSGFQQSSPGMIVQFIIFGIMTSATVLVMERNEGTLRRMRVAPVHPIEIVGGHLLALFFVAFLQELLLVVFGQHAFGLDYLHSPLGTLVILVALGLWVTSLGLLIGALVKTDLQVMIFSFISMILFSALGGAWFPLATASSEFSRLGHLLPTAWAMYGLQNIVVRGLGLNATLLAAAILTAYAIASLGLAVWRFQFE